MSSEMSSNQISAVTEQAMAPELSRLFKKGKTIVPFSETRLPYGWRSADHAVDYVDLSNYQVIEEYCPLDQVITVQCGIKIHALQQFLIGHKQWLPVAYPDQETSLLDLILADNAGPLEIFAGGLRRHILGLTFILSNGAVAKSGGTVVKNVSGYDLTRFLIGSYGYFALPIKANLRLYAIPEQRHTLVATSNSIEDLLSAARALLTKNISIAYIDMLDNRLLSERSFQYSYSLFVQLTGDQLIVDAETELVNDLFSKNQLDYKIYTQEDEQENLLIDLTQISAGGSAQNKETQTVEVSLSGHDFVAVCKHTDLIVFPFLYRPGSGRLLFRLNSSQEQNLVLEQLSQYACGNGKSLTVAYSDDIYMKKVVHFGTDTTGGVEAMQAIKRRLKDQFDPDNIFNPFVDL